MHEVEHELREHARALRSLARRLVGEDIADDLVQDVAMHALRRPPARGGSLLAWLRGVIRHLANRHRRAMRRRRAHEDVAAQRTPAEVESAQRTVEDREVLRQLTAALLELPEPYQGTLLQRFLRERTPAEIAAAAGVPVATVKSRLQRGLALLRERLDAGGRGWHAMFVATFGVERAAEAAAASAAVATTTAAGILLGGMFMKQFVVGVVVVFVLAGAWWGFDAASAADTKVVIEREATVAAVAAPVEPPPEHAREPVAAPAAEPRASEVVRELAPTTGGIEVQVVWASDHAPAPFLDVSAFEKTQRTWTKRRADEHGKATFEALAPGSYRLVVAQGRMPHAFAADVVAGETKSCELVVAGDLRLRVLVVDAEQRPLAGAAVWCMDPYADGREPALVGSTDAGGKCAYRGLPVRSVWARKPGLQPSPGHQLPELRAGDVPAEPVEVRLVLGPEGCRVAGSVLDPHGRPVADAYVALACEDTLTIRTNQMEITTRTDASGRFACDEVPAGERYVVADAPGFAPACERVTTSLGDAAAIVLTLRAGASLTGRVTDADGKPVAGADVTASRSQVLPGLRLPWGSSRTTSTDEDGRYRLEAILPGEIEARIAVRPEAVRQFTFADGQQQTWNVAVEPERAIAGIVVDPEGKPLARWMVRLMPIVRVRNMNGELGTTDAAGRFRIAELEDEPHRLFVFAPTADGHARAAAMVPRAVIENVRPSPDEITVRVDAAAMASGWIEGSIAMPAGVQARAELSVYAKVLRGGGFSVPQERLDAGQTTFRIGPLPAGEYDLLCDVEGRGRLAHKGLRLAPDETLRLPPFAADAQRPLSVVLRFADGRPVAGAAVVLRQTHEPCAEAAPGRYSSRPIEAGSYDVLVRGPDFAVGSFAVGFTGQEAPFEHTVAPATAVQVRMKPAVARERWVGAMHVQLRDAAGTELVTELTAIDGKQDFVWPIGLRPGTYSFSCSCFGDGKGSTTFTVGAAPLVVELQLVK